MKVSEEQRRTLFELLRDHLDEETARLVLEVKGVLQAEIAEETGALGANIERMGNKTLRWTVGTMLAGNTAVVALLTLMPR